MSATFASGDGEKYVPSRVVVGSSFVFDYLLFLIDKLSQNIKNATDLIEAGHVRVGTEMIKDPAFLVSRNLEDFVTWVDGSKIKEHVLSYNDMRDDFQF